jgi:X-Pro dipeptidyl-peptidase
MLRHFGTGGAPHWWRSALVAVGAGALAATAIPAAGESASPAELAPDHIVVEDGLTQPVFGYADAIREVAQVTSPVSSHDGDEPDIINVDIIRPAASNRDLRVPTIVIPSPYYSGPGRGRQGERKPTPPPTPSIVVGDVRVGGSLMDGSLPLTGQTGHLVDCGRARSPSDCPAGTQGSIALIELDADAAQTANQAPIGEPTQVENAAAAGAIGAVVYRHADGPIAGTAGEAAIPALAVTRADGLALLELVGDDANLRELVQPIDFFPLYYDNVFVPRGYAVAQVDLPGSRYSTGCLDVGGPGEVGATEAVIEWLAGEGHAVDGTTGQEVSAHWSNGRTALTGKSWDGTIPIAVAERAPEGLETIVPIAGLSHWHSDFWHSGARYGGSPTQWHDGNNNNPAMAGYCTQTRSHLAANQEDPDPDSDFWRERNWVDEVGGFEASVFVVHGMNDDNVKPVNFGRLYEQLRKHDKPRKMWLSQVEHQKAFDFRRDEWLEEIHRWYDYWLHGIDNGITDEPRVDVEHAPGEWTNYEDWPGGSVTRLWLGTPSEADDDRLGTLWPDARYSARPRTLSFQEVRRNQSQLVQNPFGEDDRRLVFLSPELSAPVHVSGEPRVSVTATVDGEQATLSAFLVDYGTAERVQYGVSGGIETFDSQTCFGEGTPADTGCYFDVGLRTQTTDVEAFTRGWVHAGFHLGLDELNPGQTYHLDWGLQHHDYVFEAGHRIGIVIAGPESGRLQSARHPTTNNQIGVDLLLSQVDLPVAGGPPALKAAFRAAGG